MTEMKTNVNQLSEIYHRNTFLGPLFCSKETLFFNISIIVPEIEKITNFSDYSAPIASPFLITESYLRPKSHATSVHKTITVVKKTENNAK